MIAGDGAVVARQRLRRVQERLEAFAGDGVLGLLAPSGGTVLLPSIPNRITAMVDALPELLDDIRAATGTDVIAGAAGCVGVMSVSRAAQQARDVLGLARRLGRPPGVYVLDDVLLEYQLTRDSDARPLLAGLLDPLESNPDLVHTLECYFERDLDRRSTATALHVHPNTLDYRLRRISQLTGLDPGKPSGQQLLAAALTARRLI
jgi:sugar diacid utilization regulator